MTSTCASFGATKEVKACARCKQVSYCNKACQKADWPQHKVVCRFTVTSTSGSEISTDALSMVCQMHNAPSTAVWQDNAALIVVEKAFNTAEIRMAVLLLLPAKSLLAAQGVCRSWYRTIALEATLQQRLFFAPGPGELILHAYEDNKVLMAIQPRNKSQLDHAMMCKRSADTVHVIASASEEKRASELEKTGVSVILNPFFTKLWPQNPANMTNNPYITIPTGDKAVSWRRMQVTSPPTMQLEMGVWVTTPNGKGTQKRLGTGRFATGVTMGHLADLLATLPSSLTRHWVTFDGYAWWARSTDAVVNPRSAGASSNNTGMTGVYVNPSNGIAFPGAF